MAGIKIPVDVETDKAQSSVGGLTKALGGIGVAAAAGLAVVATAAVAAGAAIFKLASDTAETGDAFHKMSLRTGVSTETLSALAHAADLAGTDIGTIESALKKGAKALFEADAGAAKYVDVMADLGIAVNDSAGELISQEELLFQAADAFEGMTNETEKAALAQQLFGGAGTQLLPLLNQGSEAIRAQMEEAKALGIVYSEIAAQDAADFIDAQARMSAAVDGLGKAFSEETIPVITMAMDGFADIMSSGVDDAAAFGTFVAKMLGKLVIAFGKIFPKLVKFVASLSTAWKSATRIALKNEIAIKSLNLAYLKYAGRLVDTTKEVAEQEQELGDLHLALFEVEGALLDAIAAEREMGEGAEETGRQIEQLGQDIFDAAGRARELTEDTDAQTVAQENARRAAEDEATAIRDIAAAKGEEIAALADALPWINDTITGYSGATLALDDWATSYDDWALKAAEATTVLEAQNEIVEIADGLWDGYNEELVEAGALMDDLGEETGEASDALGLLEDAGRGFLNELLGQGGAGQGLGRVNDLLGQMISGLAQGKSAMDLLKEAGNFALDLIRRLLERLIVKLLQMINLWSLLAGLMGIPTGPGGGFFPRTSSGFTSSVLGGVSDDFETLADNSVASARTTRDAILAMFSGVRISIPVDVVLGSRGDSLADEISESILNRVQTGGAI